MHGCLFYIPNLLQVVLFVFFFNGHLRVLTFADTYVSDLLGEKISRNIFIQNIHMLIF